MNRRTKYLRLRITQEEYDFLQDISAPYGSMSNYVRTAICECSNISVKQKLELIKELSNFYRQFHNELSWAGGNLNQVVKRANELAAAGLLSQSYISSVIIPKIAETQDTINSLKQELKTVTNKII